MTKIAPKLICAALILSILLSFSGCCCCIPESAIPEELTALTYVGTYKLYSVTAFGETYRGSELEDILGMDPDDCYITLNIDGTGEMSNGFSSMDIEWDEEEIWPAYAYEDPMPYTVSDGKLTVDSGTMIMVFKK